MKDNIDLKFPQLNAAKSVLTKIGVGWESRIDEFDQDFEYSSCRSEELESYIDLYCQQETSIEEKRILGCYMMECLNDHLTKIGTHHEIQGKAFKMLFNDEEVHRQEIQYRLELEDGIEEHGWPIRDELLKWLCD